MKKIFLLISLIIICSCGCDEQTFLIADNDIRLFPYEELPTITFNDSNLNEITFNTRLYKRDIYEDSNAPVPVYQGNCNDSFENLVISLGSDEGYEFYINMEGLYIEITIVDDNTSTNFGTYYTFNLRQVLSSYSVNSTIYTDVVKIYRSNSNDEIILAQDVGVLFMRFGEKEFTLVN
jgi:hypothetical protein